MKNSMTAGLVTAGVLLSPAFVAHEVQAQAQAPGRYV